MKLFEGAGKGLNKTKVFLEEEEEFIGGVTDEPVDAVEDAVVVFVRMEELEVVRGGSVGLDHLDNVITDFVDKDERFVDRLQESKTGVTLECRGEGDLLSTTRKDSDRDRFSQGRGQELLSTR